MGAHKHFGLLQPSCLVLILASLVIFYGAVRASEDGISVHSRSFYAGNVYDLENLALYDLKLSKYLFQATTVDTDPPSAAPLLINNYLEDFQDSYNVERVDKVTPGQVRNHIDNPIFIYRLIWRCYALLRSVLENAKNESGEYYEMINAIPIPVLPAQWNLKDVIQRILRIHSMYNFDVTQLSDGNIPGTEIKVSLRGIHCLELGAAALENKWFSAAVEWLGEVQRRASADGTVSPDVIEEKFRLALDLHDEAWSADVKKGVLGYGNVRIFIKPLKRNPSTEKNTKVRDSLYNATKGQDPVDIDLNSWGLCRGEDLQGPEVNSWLFCWCELKIHPFYAIGPLKMEFLNRYPDIVLVHEAFSSAEMEAAVAETSRDGGGRLYPSFVQSRKNHAGTGASIRSSATAHLQYNDVERRINRKLQTMIALETAGYGTTSEKMQIVGYAPGGFYGAHTDALAREAEESLKTSIGDRLATFMIYLTNVDYGGSTVFPASFAFAKPTKGSAVFWYNVMSSGGPDFATLHGSCPVVVGQKWIATKFISMNDQFRGKPCPLKPAERFQVPVNGQFLSTPPVLRKRLGRDDELLFRQQYSDFASSSEQETTLQKN